VFKAIKLPQQANRWKPIIALSRTDKQFTEKKKFSICCNDEFIKNHKDRLFNNKQQYPI